MIRFLQTPGPVKKYILGGLLTIICVFMVITLVPGFGSTDFFGSRAPGQGVVATVAGDDITTPEVPNARPSRCCSNNSMARPRLPCFCLISPRRPQKL